MSGYRLHKVDVTASTNDDVKKAVAMGETEGYAVQAAQQTAGRGRHGRIWHSPQGNIYCSVLLMPESLAPLGHYSFIAALAIADMVGHVLPQADIALKWPNDVLIAGRKVSGILLEALDRGLVIGMGVNVAHHPEDSLYPSSSLTKAGLAHDIKLDPLVHVLLDRLWHWYGVLQKDGFAPVRQAWLDLALKGAVSVRLPQQTVQGQFSDLGPDGSLRLRLADGTERSIASGDVFHSIPDAP